MDSQEWARLNPTISKQTAQRLVRQHTCSWAELVADLGDHATYRSRKVLAWLGY
jgi:hypothetical protein